MLRIEKKEKEKETQVLRLDGGLRLEGRENGPVDCRIRDKRGAWIRLGGLFLGAQRISSTMEKKQLLKGESY